MTAGTIHEVGFIKLKREIPHAGCTQRKLAGKLGITPQALNNKLAGRSAFTLRDVWIIGQTLGIPKSEILDYFPEELCK